MKVLFVYPNQESNIQMPFGIAYLSAVLKNEGHKTLLFDTTFQSFNDLKSILEKFKPDIVCTSATTNTYELALKVNNFIKEKLNCVSVFGGIHPTISPEEVINEKNIDFVIVGESELALAELVNKLENCKRTNNVKNLVYKKGNKIIKTPLRPLIQDLDSLPFPDRKLFDKRHIVLEYPGSPFLTARGCPYNCTYCVNHTLQNLYCRQKFVRFRAIDKVIEEIKETIREFNITKVLFQDETFTLNENRVLEFCRKYKKEINLPFRCMTRVDAINKTMIKALKEAGCQSIHYGVETGNEFFRKTRLKRDITDRQIIDAFSLAKKHNIKTSSFNMVGLPFDTKETVWQGIMLNNKIMPDNLNVTFFHPYKGTELGEECVKDKMVLSSSMPGSDYHSSILKVPGINEKEMVSLQRFYGIYVKSPKMLFPFVSALRWMYKRTVDLENKAGINFLRHYFDEYLDRMNYNIYEKRFRQWE